MSRFHSGPFTPKNSEKYAGSYPIVYRSSWELTFMNLCDQHPNVIQWAFESVRIPYQNPLTGKWHQYIPDFLIVYMDKAGKTHGEIIEIKPMAQAVVEAARTRRAQEIVAINHAKWQAAVAWCHHQGLKFRVMTQEQLFRSPGR